jgi:hypothetical protein
LSLEICSGTQAVFLYKLMYLLNKSGKVMNPKPMLAFVDPMQSAAE